MKRPGWTKIYDARPGKGDTWEHREDNMDKKRNGAPGLWYSVVTFGRPSIRYRKVHRTFDSAKETADACKGTGSCSDARVVECNSRASARAADISGEHNVAYHA